MKKQIEKIGHTKLLKSRVGINKRLNNSYKSIVSNRAMRDVDAMDFHVKHEQSDE